MVLEWREYTNAVGKSARYWSDCVCVNSAVERAQAQVAASATLHADYRAEGARQSLPAALNAFTLETFDCFRLDGGAKLVAASRRWLDSIAALPVAPGYHTDPRPCLYFYSPGKGRGKTHLAVALMHLLAAQGRSVAFADEISYIEAYWAASLEQKAQLSAYPAERAWLTVLDDLGQRERTTDTLRDAWYDVINPRWLKRGWTIITSNWTPDELLTKGTINEATHSRLAAMTRGQIVTFLGSDQRLPGGGL